MTDEPAGNDLDDSNDTQDDSIDYELPEEYRDDWVRVPFAAAWLGRHYSTLYRQIAAGVWETKKVGPLTLVSRQQMMGWELGKPRTKMRRKDETENN